MQYMGGKERQAKHVVQVIKGHMIGHTDYLEPFIGGGSIFSRVAPLFPGRAVGADSHPDLVLMWDALMCGWEPPAGITRQQYAELRNEEPSALRGFVGFGCSFGGKWFGGYASNKRGDDFCGAARRGVLRKSVGMRLGHVVRADYREFAPGPGTLVYCDPPYADTTRYSGDCFDSAEFWRVMREWSANGASVLVSEYSAPIGVPAVWERTAVKSLRKDSNTDPATEKIFRLAA